MTSVAFDFITLIYSKMEEEGLSQPKEINATGFYKEIRS